MTSEAEPARHFNPAREVSAFSTLIPTSVGEFTGEIEEMAFLLKQQVAHLAHSERTPRSKHHAEPSRNLSHKALPRRALSCAETRWVTGSPWHEYIAEWPSAASNDAPIVILGAHYDTMPGVPGADDNASGVAALLQVAAWLASERALSGNRVRLQLAFYDLEEYGLVGSREHAHALRAAGVSVIFIGLEMIGFASEIPGTQGSLSGVFAEAFPSAANFLAVCGNLSAEMVAQLVVRCARVAGGLQTVALQNTNATVAAWSRMSDHSSFWDVAIRL